MLVYLYSAALWCGPCVIENLIANGKASPAARDMDPADALEQILSSNGFTEEAEYDSDDLPKGPYGDGGGEADSPQHCDGCGIHLENPLTADGVEYVRTAISEYHDRGPRDPPVGNQAVLLDWSDFYADDLFVA